MKIFNETCVTIRNDLMSDKTFLDFKKSIVLSFELNVFWRDPGVLAEYTVEASW